MGYKKVYRAATIESSSSENLHKRYQYFLDSLDTTPDCEIISVNYQTMCHRLESEDYNSGVSYSVLVTYSTGIWVDDGSGEVKNG